jgi:hypothetical protein|eukprot:COSAG06_NODE_7632_length_2433_cov_1.721080_4_plen_70_part_00
MAYPCWHNTLSPEKTSFSAMEISICDGVFACVRVAGRELHLLHAHHCVLARLDSPVGASLLVHRGDAGR